MTSPSSHPAIRLDIAALTDKGVKRAANEDAYGLFDLPSVSATIVVADGMGGLQSGDVASGEAVSVMEATLRERIGAGDTPGDAFAESFARANERVFAIAEAVRLRSEETAKQAEADMPTAKRGDYSKTAPAPKSSTPLMGTTVVAGIIRGDVLTVAHAGDSRLYRLRGGVLAALTSDHSFVAERVRAGDISEEEARVSRFRNMITRAVGIDAAIQPEVKTETLEPGDTLLFCTDGLNTMIDDAEIGSILARADSAKGVITSERIATALVDAANRRGGSDNITVVVVRVLGADSDSPAAPVPLAPAAAKKPEPRPAPAMERRVDKRPEVMDMEATRAPGRNRGSVPPFVALLAFIGVLTLGVGAILAASKEVRQNIGHALAPRPAPVSLDTPVGEIRDGVIHIKDYTKMTYKAPVPFGDRIFSARGDLLAYSPRAGIFFVTDSGGQMAYLSKAGQVMKPIASFVPQPPPPKPAPASRVFFAADLQGNTYISYPARKLIEKYDRNGVKRCRITSTESPEALVVDEDGNLYVIYDGTIKKLEAVMPTAGTTPAVGTPTKPKASASP